MALTHVFLVILWETFLMGFGEAELPGPRDGADRQQIPGDSWGSKHLGILAPAAFLVTLVFLIKDCAQRSPAKMRCRAWTFLCRKKTPFPDEESSIICFRWGKKPLKVKYKHLDTLLLMPQEELDEVFMEEEEEEADLHTWHNTRLCFLEPPEETILSEELTHFGVEDEWPGCCPGEPQGAV
ncbi:uncharacterized protein LOC143842740 [Paroedura picta]|uniref:uncharacterized protein LOC143842740 n=1 Tax=Paroedura picta TaxID=143630 RepID=UPI0040578B66